MDMGNITRRLRQFREDRDWRRHHSLRNLAISLNVEASELLELIQWVDDDQVDSWLADERHRAAATDEIADVFIYLTYLVDLLGVDLESAVLAKIDRNANRFPLVRELNDHEEPEAQR